MSSSSEQLRAQALWRFFLSYLRRTVYEASIGEVGLIDETVDVVAKSLWIFNVRASRLREKWGRTQISGLLSRMAW